MIVLVNAVGVMPLILDIDDGKSISMPKSVRAAPVPIRLVEEEIPLIAKPLDVNKNVSSKTEFFVVNVTFAIGLS
jgi:hypothetical protein